MATAGFERSGHFFFNQPIGRGYDDGIISALEVLKILDNNRDKTFSNLYKELPATFSSPTMSPKCSDEVKYRIVDKIEKIFKNKKLNNNIIAGQRIISIITINGVRIQLEDGSWGLIRASSNSPNLVVVCESSESKEKMQQIFSELNGVLSEFNEIGDYDQKI